MKSYLTLVIVGVAMLCACGTTKTTSSANVAIQKTIKVREPNVKDVMTLLERSGYQLFTYDLTSLLDGRYDITVRIREYENGVQTGEDRVLGLGENKWLVSDFDPSVQAQITPEMMVDPASQTYMWADQLNIGFYPSEIDSVAYASIESSMGGYPKQPFKLRPIEKYNNRYEYGFRQFKIEKFEPNKFIPLVFFGSHWFDERANVIRFCGDAELTSDLSNEIVQYVPHFYIIGIEFQTQEE
ncbi:MAG: DUF5041 domain-containing protein [Rikenellaceae bacterium]|nr:DUF5041 domain-containing protein [Rikenellaceae bacterium]